MRSGNQSITKVKAQIYAELADLYNSSPVSKLSDVVESVEKFMTLVLRTQIISRADSFLKNSEEAEDGDYIICGDEVVVLEMTENAASRRTLEIALLLRNPSRRRPRLVTKTFKRESFGRYSEFEISWSVELDIQWDQLCFLVQVVVDTIYLWLENFIDSKLVSVETKLASDLYAYARTTFHCGEWLERFWFVAVQNDKGYCLFDHRSAQNVIAIASRVTRNTELTPAGISVHFVVSEADFDLMIAKDSIAMGQCIDVPFSKAKYKNTDLDFSEAEATIHQADSITLFPLVREGKGFLLAGFPTPARGVFEPLLKEHEAEIVAIFKESLDSLKVLVKKLKKTVHGEYSGTLGKFVGGMFKEIFMES